MGQVIFNYYFCNDKNTLTPLKIDKRKLTNGNFDTF